MVPDPFIARGEFADFEQELTKLTKKAGLEPKRWLNAGGAWRLIRGRSSQGKTRLELVALRPGCQRQVERGDCAVAVDVCARGCKPGRV